jgi:hypothetical protein
MHEIIKEDWFKLSTFEQLTDIGFEVEKAINLRKNDSLKELNNVIQRTITLLELTIVDPKTQYRSREIANIKLLLLDDFCGNNEYQSTDNWWIKYFGYFKHLINTQKDNICRK